MFTLREDQFFPPRLNELFDFFSARWTHKCIYILYSIPILNILPKIKCKHYMDDHAVLTRLCCLKHYTILYRRLHSSTFMQYIV